MKKTFSIVVPVYQNEPNLDDTIPAILEFSQKLEHYETELIFVDDGSTDNSYPILLKYQSQHPSQIKILRLTRNFGQNPASCAGFAYAKGDVIGRISADLQDPVELFDSMIKIWESGCKLVVACREGREETGVGSVLSNYVHIIIKKHINYRYPKGGFDFFLFDREVSNRIVSIAEKNSHLPSLLMYLGYRHQEIPYVRRKRLKGVSQYTLARKIKVLIDIFITNSYLPVRFISIAGGITILISLLFILITIFGRNNEFSISHSTAVFLLCFIGGVILLALGIIGEYLWRIFENTKKRPLYVVEERVGFQHEPLYKS